MNSDIRSASPSVNAADGSQTMTLTAHSADAVMQSPGNQILPNPNVATGVLHLRGGPRSRPQVAWVDDVVDNEGCGRKKSKICCIYHKPRPFDESSDESDGSSDDSCGERSHPHSHDRRSPSLESRNTPSTGHGADISQGGDGKLRGQNLKNAYEAESTYGRGGSKGKSRADA